METSHTPAPSRLTSAIEQEVKFRPSEELQGKLLAALTKDRGPQELAETLRAALGLGAYTVSQVENMVLLDEYYDTNDLTIAREHGSFRLRRGKTKPELTLKLGGEVRAGQFKRREMSIDLDEDQALAHRRSGFAFVIAALRSDLAGPLNFVVSVANERRTFRVERGPVVFYLSVDNYYVSNRSRKRKGPFFEIEIEAASEAAATTLSELQTKLQQVVPGLQFARESKYERALDLFALRYPVVRRAVIEAVQTEPIGVASFIVGIASLILAIIQFL